MTRDAVWQLVYLCSEDAARDAVWTGSLVRVSTLTHGPPEWCSDLRHCIAMLAVSLQILIRSQNVAAGRDRETHKVVHNWLSVVRVRGGFDRPSCPCPIAL